MARAGMWLVQKLAAAALIVLVALAGYGLWLFLQDERFLEDGRVGKLQQAVAERDRLVEAKAGLERRIAGIHTEIETQKERARQAERVISVLRELESWWDRWFGNPAQQTANAEQLQRMERLKVESGGKISELERAVTRILWEKDGLELALGRVTREIAFLENARSLTRHYVRAAWDSIKWYVAFALASYLFGPTLWALSMYFGLAPLMSRGRPIRLGPDPPALPEVGRSHVSIDTVLAPGEILRIKESFLQASDEGIGRQTRFVLDWRIPVTSLACGLVELVEMQNRRETGDYHVTLSNSSDPHIELAEVRVPAGASLVLRPTFLAGVVQDHEARLQIRRHWRIFKWQAWVTGQFRFFEFVGPCRLVVAGSRGVRAERLVDREGVAAPARRTNQDATIAFTPNLEYRPVRAETFWSYYRGMNPLFDDLFAGQGIFVLQETATEGSAATAGRFWSTVWSGVLKVFGL